MSGAFMSISASPNSTVSTGSSGSLIHQSASRSTQSRNRRGESPLSQLSPFSSARHINVPFSPNLSSDTLSDFSVEQSSMPIENLLARHQQIKLELQQVSQKKTGVAQRYSPYKRLTTLIEKNCTDKSSSDSMQEEIRKDQVSLLNQTRLYDKTIGKLEGEISSIEDQINSRLSQCREELKDELKYAQQNPMPNQENIQGIQNAVYELEVGTLELRLKLNQPLYRILDVFRYEHNQEEVKGRLQKKLQYAQAKLEVEERKDFRNEVYIANIKCYRDSLSRSFHKIINQDENHITELNQPILSV